MFTCISLASHCRDSWKWQNAYHLSTYTPHLTRRGYWVWTLISQGPKVSLPQAVRRYGNLPVGGLHHVRLTTAESSAAVFAAAGMM